MQTRTSLARIYRPNTFAELEGQQELVQALTSAFKQAHIPQAIILHGIRGTGKTTTARIIAKCLNCIGEDGKQTSPIAAVCDQCVSCKAITGGQHLDVVEIDAASNTGVDDMREIIESARYKAVQGRYKVFIVDEVHMLSKSAFNALLKTLEEPPRHVCFIFATTEIRKIPATVLSRCMRFDLNKMSLEHIAKRIKHIAQSENFTIDDDAISYLFRASEGSMRDALSLLDQACLLVQNDQKKDITSAIVRNMIGSCDQMTILKLLELSFLGNVSEVITTLKDLYQGHYAPHALLQDLLHAVYWLICYKTTPTLAHDPAWPQEERAFAKRFVGQITTSSLLQAWQILNKSYVEISQSPIPEQALEVLLVRFCYLKDLIDLDQIVKKLDSQGEKTSIEDTKNNTNSLINSFDDIVKWVQEKKEAMLHSHLLHDIEVISCRAGELVCYVNTNVPKDFAQRLTNILQGHDNVTWNITIQKKEENVKSVRQIEKDDIQAKEQKTLNHPSVKKLREYFPDAEIRIEK